MSPDQIAWEQRARARQELCRPGIQWQHRRSHRRVTIIRIEGLRVIYKTKNKERWPSGKAEVYRANFLSSFTPVSESWTKIHDERG